ncbi:MAG: DUF503 domain-containing protein [Oscillospiraceae bacterium]|nr:DUF503 domain-containing protein [Oscillospiraceae bacterium]
MNTLTAILTFHIPHADSLKDKRQVSRSLIAKTRQKFNVSIAEVDSQDVRRTLTIGLAVVSGEMTHARDSLDEAVRFLENNAFDLGAELTGTEYA